MQMSPARTTTETEKQSQSGKLAQKDYEEGSTQLTASEAKYIAPLVQETNAGDRATPEHKLDPLALPLQGDAPGQVHGESPLSQDPKADRGLLKRLPKVAPPKVVANAFYEFCWETGLDGFKYLCKEKRQNRVFWWSTCIILSALTFYHSVVMISEDLADPLQINVDRHFYSELTFPQIVICNTMPFRSSQVRPNHAMHNALHHIYATDTPTTWLDLRENDPNIIRELGSVKDTKSYLQSIAHQKEDMIISCRWQMEPCDLSDFTTVITDSGVCYAFNALTSDTNEEHLKTVHQSGSDYGLELVLNVETYEAMNGPYNTYGVKVGFIKQGYPPIMKKAVNTLLGAYTEIGLAASKAEFVACGSEHLQFFERYTREACVMEHAIYEIENTCKCEPYTTEITRRNKTTGVPIKQCNLAEHFFCAEPFLVEPPNRDRVDCPTECENYHYTPTVSIAKVAWDTVKAQIERETPGIETRLQEKVLKALEVSKRYRPRDNETTTHLFDSLRDAVTTALEFVQSANNLSSGMFKAPPPNSGPPQLSEEFEQFTKLVYEPAVNEMRAVLHYLNRTLTSAMAVFRNPLTSPFLLANKTLPKNARAEDFGLTSDVFNVVGGRVYLNSLTQLLQGLDLLKEIKEELSREAEECFFVGETTILRANGTQFYNETMQKFQHLITKTLEIYESTNAARETVSGDKSWFESKFEHASDEVDLLDIILCFLDSYTSPNTKVSIAQLLALHSQTIPTNVVDVDQQAQICRALLCKNFANEGSNCAISPDEMAEFAKKLEMAIQDAVRSSYAYFDDAVHSMDALLEHYRSVLLPKYSAAVNHATTYAKNSAKIAEIVSKGSLFPPMPPLNKLLANLSSYANSSITYYELSKVVTGFYATWMEFSFNFYFIKAKSSLTEGHSLLRSMEATIFELLNISKTDDIEDTRRGVFHMVASNVLWKEANVENLQESVSQVIRLRELKRQLLRNISNVAGDVDHAFEALLVDCTSFMDKAKVDEAFFQKNLMVINVNMQSISEEVVMQSSTRTFWNIIASLGGAGSFWLGVSFVHMVELAYFLAKGLFRCARTGTESAVREVKKNLEKKQTKLFSPSVGANLVSVVRRWSNRPSSNAVAPAEIKKIRPISGSTAYLTQDSINSTQSAPAEEHLSFYPTFLAHPSLLGSRKLDRGNDAAGEGQRQVSFNAAGAQAGGTKRDGRKREVEGNPYI